MYLMFSHLQKPCQVVITYTLRQRAQDVILLFPLLALIISVALDRWLPNSMSCLSAHLLTLLSAYIMNFLLQGLCFYTIIRYDKLESMPWGPGLFRRIVLSQGSSPRGCRQRGLLGKVLGSNRARVRGNSGLKALCGLKVTWRQGKLQVNVL